jgi:hypothetical protein
MPEQMPEPPWMVQRVPNAQGLQGDDNRQLHRRQSCLEHADLAF